MKRSVSLHGHRTSLALEAEFWEVIDQVAKDRSMAMAALVAEIDEERDPDDSLSSAMRVYALRKALSWTKQSD